MSDVAFYGLITCPAAGEPPSLHINIATHSVANETSLANQAVTSIPRTHPLRREVRSPSAD